MHLLSIILLFKRCMKLFNGYVEGKHLILLYKFLSILIDGNSLGVSRQNRYASDIVTKMYRNTLITLGKIQ